MNKSKLGQIYLIINQIIKDKKDIVASDTMEFFVCINRVTWRVDLLEGKIINKQIFQQVSLRLLTHCAAGFLGVFVGEWWAGGN